MDGLGRPSYGTPVIGIKEHRMNIRRLSACVSVAALLIVYGCTAHPSEEPVAPTAAQEKSTGEKKETPKATGEIKRAELGKQKNIILETQGESRRVLVKSEVCLREGLLEQLLTRKRTKEHEAILAADIDARDLHLALTLTGAEPGKVVQFRPKLAAPTGTPIKISLEYKKDGKTVRVSAKEWIRNIKSKKDFPTDWVFAGSTLIPDPLDKTKLPFYGANDGDVIAIVNFESSCLDVPFLNTKDNDDLAYEAHTERIPALKTPVTVILEPVLEKKK
jgi:hypothetical protein